MEFRYLHTATVLLLLTLVGTGCGLIEPAPTPFPIFPTATVRPSPIATATLPPAPVGTPTLPPSPPTAAPTAVSQPPGNPQPQVKRISFPAGGTSATIQGNLAANGIDRYVLRALAGQTMTVNFAPSVENVTMQISGADGNVLASGAARISTWSAQLPTTQDYYLAVVSNAAVAANYTLTVTIPPLGSTVVPDNPRRITFAPGGTSATIQGATATPGQDRFVIRALAGQTMTASVASTQGPVILIIYGADGNVLISDHAGASSWNGTLPSTQDYLIDTRSVGAAVVSFTLTVTIPPK